jgi:hypothetical protein
MHDSAILDLTCCFSFMSTVNLYTYNIYWYFLMFPTLCVLLYFLLQYGHSDSFHCQCVLHVPHELATGHAFPIGTYIFEHSV